MASGRDIYMYENDDKIKAEKEKNEKEKNEKDKEVLTKAVELLVVKVRDQAVEITNIKNRMKKLEDIITTLNFDLQINKSNTEIANFHANAEEDLYKFMYAEKDEDATDFPMTKADIHRGLKKYAERSGVRVVDDDSAEEDL